MTAATNVYTTNGQGATLAELAERSCVGRDAARRCLGNMTRSGELAIVGERRVEYRNRPVAVYAPAASAEAAQQSSQPWVDLNNCMADWLR